MLWRWMDQDTGKMCKFDDETGTKLQTITGTGGEITLYQTKQHNYVAIYLISWANKSYAAALWTEREVLERLALYPKDATSAGLRLLEEKDICEEV